MTSKTEMFRCERKSAFALGRIVLPPDCGRPGRAADAPLAAFTLIEVLLGAAVTAIMLVSLYAGFTFGFQQTHLAQLNERATQILEEKMELVRLLNWSQLTTPGFVPTSFQESYDASNPTNAASGSFIYSGTVLITNAPVTETYSNDLRMVQVQVSWLDNGKTHTRKMTTFVSQYGMQNYIY